MQYISGSYIQGQLLKSIDEVERALTQEFLSNGPITTKFDQVYWRDRVIDASFGRNTVLFDDMGNPSVMVMIEHNRNSLIDGTREKLTHPAFIVNGELKPKIYISKYPNMVVGDFGVDARPVSLKGVDARGNYSLAGAATICRDKGIGWHLLTNAEFSAIALESWANGFFPRGNSNYGRSSEVESETGIPSYIPGNFVNRVLTGSGPASWSHDGTPYGIYDLHGGMHERVAGLQFVNREINIIPNNDAASHESDVTPQSSLWKSILDNGSLVAPGTADALGLITVSGAMRVTKNVTAFQSTLSADFAATEPNTGVNIPDLLKSLTIYPKNKILPSPGRFILDGEGVATVARGGSWSQPGFINIEAKNTFADPQPNVGFRAAFIEGV